MGRREEGGGRREETERTPSGGVHAADGEDDDPAVSAVWDNVGWIGNKFRFWGRDVRLDGGSLGFGRDIVDGHDDVVRM